MYLHGARFTTGRVNARALLPDVLEAMQAGSIHPEKVTTEIVPWDSAIDAFRELSVKPVFIRD